MSGSPFEWRFRAFGTSFALRGNNQVMLRDAVLRARSLGWTEANDDDGDVGYVVRRRKSHDPNRRWSFDVHCDGALIRRTTDRTELLDAFEDHAKIQTAYHAKDYVFVHAGVVSWRGRGILLPGRSHTGKSMLVKALIEAGAQYFSDEFAVLDARGCVHPYALPLSIRANGSQPAVRIPVEAFGGRIGDGPVPVNLIVVTRYDRGVRWRPRPLSGSDAFLALMENTVAARQPPERTMPILRQAVLTARAIHSRRGDAGAVARAVVAQLG